MRGPDCVVLSYSKRLLCPKGSGGVVFKLLHFKTQVGHALVFPLMLNSHLLWLLSGLQLHHRLQGGSPGSALLLSIHGKQI